MEKRRGRFSPCQDGKCRRFPEEDDFYWYSACTVLPPPGPPSQICYLFIFIHSFENNETIRVGAQVEIGPMGMAPAAAFVESPHSGQQVSVTRAKIVFRPQGRNRSKLGPPFGPSSLIELIPPLVYTICCGTQHISSGEQHIYDMLFLCAHGTHVKQWVSCGHSLVDWDVDFPRADPLLPSKSR